MRKNESKPVRKRGGQPGNQNARTHGFYTKDGRKRLEDMGVLVRDCHALLKAITEGDVSDLHRLGLTQLGETANGAATANRRKAPDASE